MVYPLNAVASLLVLRNSRVPQAQQGALTALSAFTPGVLGLAVPIVAASAAQRGKGSALLGRHRPQPPPPPDPPPSFAKVPNVVGSTFDTASKTLDTWGFSASRGADVYSDDADGTVIQQHPHAGRLERLDAVVTLTVSKKGPPPEPPTEETEMAELKTIEGMVQRVLDNQKATTPTPPTPTPSPSPSPTTYGGDDPTKKKT